MDLFELRLPGFGRRAQAADESGEAEAKKQAVQVAPPPPPPHQPPPPHPPPSPLPVQGKAVDDDGLKVALDVFYAQRTKRQRLAMLTGGGGGSPGEVASAPPTQFVLASASAALGYEQSWGEAQETEFGFRKRVAEASLRLEANSGDAAGVAFPHAIVRAAKLDDLRLDENLPLLYAAGVVAGEGESGEAGVVDGEMGERRIHPRDFAKALVGGLRGGGGGGTKEVWTTAQP